MPTEKETRDKLLSIITDGMNMAVQLGPKGRLRLDFKDSSTALFLRVYEMGVNEKYTIINGFCPILRKVKPAPELYEWVATEGADQTFGHVGVNKEEDGTVSVFFTHTILGDFVDEQEVAALVWSCQAAANRLDDELKQKFGGLRFVDPD